MRKRLLACALALCMAFLCACGGGSGSSSTPVPPDNSATEEPPAETDRECEDPWAIADELFANGFTDEEVHTMFARGEISESVLSAWVELMDYMPSSGGWEAVEPEPELPTKPEKLEGLIFVNYWPDDVQIKGQSIPRTNCEIYCYNPETGNEFLVSQFIPPYWPDSGDHCDILYLTMFNIRKGVFSDDYSKLAATKYFAADGETHAGWLDANGNFFDVTEALGLQSKSDFEDPVYYSGNGFQDGYFGYSQRFLGESRTDRYYVPLDNLMQDAIHEGDVHNRSGQFDEDGVLYVKGYPSYFLSDVTSWIDDTRCLFNEDDSNRHYHSHILDTATGVSEKYIPGTSRESWNGVASPDGTQIAFMSAPINGASKVADIYTIPVEGGEPVKITGYSFTLTDADRLSRLYYQKQGGFTLIDWK